MADDIRMDKVVLREAVKASLDRLMSQNYIARTGDSYNFLTDEEQDIQREIKNTQVDTYSIVERIGQMIFGDIYPTKKYRYGKYDFAFDQMVDGVTVGSVTGGMRLRFLTVASDAIEKSELRLVGESKGKEAIVVLEDTPYYEALESAMKIRRYVLQRNVTQLPKSVQDIIRNQQEEAGKYELSALEDLKKAIEAATFYVDGECIEAKGSDAKSKIDQAMEYLVSHVYSELKLITKNAESDADIIAILNGNSDDGVMAGLEENRDAAAKMEEYLVMQSVRNLPTSMADIQSRYSGIPYGWREIDIAAVAARLIFDQKVTVKYAGTTIQPENLKLPDMLRKKSEIGKTDISKRQVVSAAKTREAREFLREYFEVMDVPNDEDSLIKFIIDKFTEQKAYFEELNDRYNTNKYPDRHFVQGTMTLISDILSQQKDNTALIERVIKKEDELEDSKNALKDVTDFFRSQVGVFDVAVKLEANLRNDFDYIAKDEETEKALNQIRLITMIPSGTGYNYKLIPDLNGHMAKVKAGHDKLLNTKREELLEIVRQCMAEVHQAANGNVAAHDIITKADEFFTQRKERIAEINSLALLDGLVPPMWTYKDNACERIEHLLKPVPPRNPDQVEEKEKTNQLPKKFVKTIHRQAVFPAKKLESEEEIDAYVEKMRSYLKTLLQDCDGIQLN